jgi:signal transduction histidine kinase
MTPNSQTERFEFLKRIPLFAELGETDLRKLCSLVGDVRLAAGEELFRQGGDGDLAYVIREGEIQISRFSEGQEIPLAVRRPGEVIGEMALLEQVPRMASARARTDSLLLAIGRRELDQLLTSSPTAARSMLGTVMGRLRETEAALRQNEKMAQLGTLAAGLAHELNNPASAALRGAEQLRAALAELLAGPNRVAGLGLTAAQFQELARRMESAGKGNPRSTTLGTMERGDLEEQVERWLEGRGVREGQLLAAELVETGYDPAELEALEKAFPAPQLEQVLHLVWVSCRANSLLAEIALGAREISSIVKAMKSYVYLDQAPVQEVDLQEGLENTLVILRHKLKRGIEVRREFQPDLPRVPARGGELNQVWTNLIDNAADALGGKGQVILRTRREGAWAVVEVEDDGPGIPVEIQPKVFTLFFTTKPMGQGSGQGLSTAYGIVRRHGGNLVFRSEPGRTVFSVRLPLSAPPSG